MKRCQMCGKKIKYKDKLLGTLCDAKGIEVCSRNCYNDFEVQEQFGTRENPIVDLKGDFN